MCKKCDSGEVEDVSHWLLHEVCSMGGATAASGIVIQPGSTWN